MSLNKDEHAMLAVRFLEQADRKSITRYVNEWDELNRAHPEVWDTVLSKYAAGQQAVENIGIHKVQNCIDADWGRLGTTLKNESANIFKVLHHVLTLVPPPPSVQKRREKPVFKPECVAAAFISARTEEYFIGVVEGWKRCVKRTPDQWKQNIEKLTVGRPMVHNMGLEQIVVDIRGAYPALSPSDSCKVVGEVLKMRWPNGPFETAAPTSTGRHSTSVILDDPAMDDVLAYGKAVHEAFDTTMDLSDIEVRMLADSKSWVRPNPVRDDMVEKANRLAASYKMGVRGFDVYGALARYMKDYLACPRSYSLNQITNRASENPMSLTPIKIETVVLVTPAGCTTSIDARKLTDDQLFQAIQDSENEINRLNGLVNKPKKVADRIIELQNGIDALVAVSNNGGKPVDVVATGKVVAGVGAVSGENDPA